MAEIKHAEFPEAADLLGHFGQIVFGQNQSFQLGLVPNGFWHFAKPLFPEVQIRHTGDANRDTVGEASMNTSEVEALFAQTLVGDYEAEEAWDAIHALRRNGSLEV